MSSRESVLGMLCADFISPRIAVIYLKQLTIACIAIIVDVSHQGESTRALMHRLVIRGGRRLCLAPMEGPREV